MNRSRHAFQQCRLGLLGLFCFAIITPAMAQKTIHYVGTDYLTLEISEDGVRKVSATHGSGLINFFNEELRLDKAGRLLSYTNVVPDSLNLSEPDRFWKEDGKAHWVNLLGSGSAEAHADSFYFTGLGSWELTAAIVRFARDRPGGTVEILPRGRAKIKAVDELVLARGEEEVSLDLYALEFLAMHPLYLWLDDAGELFAVLDDGRDLVRKGWQEGLPALRSQQAQVERQRLKGLTRLLTEPLPEEYVIENLHLVDVAQGRVEKNQRVVVKGGKISQVGPPLSDDFKGKIINANGRWLAPGLWDMHGHFTDRQGLEALASGITTVRDVGSRPEELVELIRAFDSGEIMGPRLIPSGFLDGPCSIPPCDLGPNVDSEAAGRALIEQYAELGFPQLKLYANVNRRWVKPLALAAHDLGLKVSGHIPAHSSVKKVIVGGYDEVTHISSLVRYLAPATKRIVSGGMLWNKYDKKLDPNRRKVRRLLELMVENNTVLDPTLVIYHDFLLHQPGAVFPPLEPVRDVLPPYERFMFAKGARALDEKKKAQAERNAAALRRLLAAAHEKGIAIVPGSDGGAGYYYLRELELYVEAGLLPAEVMRLASLGSAEVMGMGLSQGSIAAGKPADLLLLDANPLKDISALRRVHRVIKGQRSWRPVALRKALHLEPPRAN